MNSRTSAAAIAVKSTSSSHSWRGALLTAVGAALAVVIVAPIALSSSDLVRWAHDPDGLGLEAGWAWLVFVALDCAAAVCVGMVIYSAWRGEAAGAFHVLTWLFAGGSAIANWRHGTTTPARDDQYFFPAMSVAGPMLLEFVLARVRRWVRTEDQTQISVHPKFGSRWLPGVAFRETLKAWQVSRREGIARPVDAIDWVRDLVTLMQLHPVDQWRYAVAALGGSPEQLTIAQIIATRRWLAGRGIVLPEHVIAASRLGPASPTSGAHLAAAAGHDLASASSRPAALSAGHARGLGIALAQIAPAVDWPPTTPASTLPLPLGPAPSAPAAHHPGLLDGPAASGPSPDTAATTGPSTTGPSTASPAPAGAPGTDPPPAESVAPDPALADVPGPAAPGPAVAARPPDAVAGDDCTSAADPAPPEPVGVPEPSPTVPSPADATGPSTTDPATGGHDDDPPLPGPRRQEEPPPSPAANPAPPAGGLPARWLKADPAQLLDLVRQARLIRPDAGEGTVRTLLQSKGLTASSERIRTAIRDFDSTPHPDARALQLVSQQTAKSSR